MKNVKEVPKKREKNKNPDFRNYKCSLLLYFLLTISSAPRTYSSTAWEKCLFKPLKAQRKYFCLFIQEDSFREFLESIKKVTNDVKSNNKS